MVPDKKLENPCSTLIHTLRRREPFTRAMFEAVGASSTRRAFKITHSQNRKTASYPLFNSGAIRPIFATESLQNHGMPADAATRAFDHPERILELK